MKTKTKTPAARDGKWFLREIKRRAADDPARAIRFDVKPTERAALLNAYLTIAEGRPEADDRANVFTAKQKKPRGAVPARLSCNGWKVWRDEPLAPGKRGDVERWAFFPPAYVWPQPVERFLVATVKDTIAKRFDTAALAQKTAAKLRAKYEKIQVETGQDYFVEMVGCTASEPDPEPGLYCHVWRGEDWLLVSRAEAFPAELPEAITTFDRERERLEGILTAVEERRNVFASMGDLWLVAYDGRRAFVPDCKGMPYLFEILKRAASATGNDGGLTPADLCREAHLPPPNMLSDGKRLADDHEDPTGTTEADRNAIDAHDEEMRRRYMADPEARKKVAELKQKLRTATGADKRTIQKTLRMIGEGDPRRRRRPPDQNRERARVRVANAIRRALDDIAKYHPVAADHLRAKVRPENGRYSYPGPAFTT
jgi:hypothetical protein